MTSDPIAAYPGWRRPNACFGISILRARFPASRAWPVLGSVRRSLRRPFCGSASCEVSIPESSLEEKYGVAAATALAKILSFVDDGHGELRGEKS
jgi:hypothetical protein